MYRNIIYVRIESYHIDQHIDMKLLKMIAWLPCSFVPELQLPQKGILQLESLTIAVGGVDKEQSQTQSLIFNVVWEKE